jgi:protein-tyrosine-phosphatase
MHTEMSPLMRQCLDATVAELGVDLGEEFPKPLTDEVVRAADAIITMGCGDACPQSDRHPPNQRGPALNRVAVITDIHGNLPALEASLAAIDTIGVGALYCGGDLVGYGPHPNEVCRLIEEREIPTIYGNYDYAIGRELNDCVGWQTEGRRPSLRVRDPRARGERRRTRVDSARAL